MHNIAIAHATAKGRLAIMAGSGLNPGNVEPLLAQGVVDEIHDGKRMNGCLTLVVQCEGRQVITIEGIAPSDAELHPVQEAFIRHDAFQCGYCTPGQIVSAVACIAEGHTRSEAEVREWMSGNICRCAAYPQITAAVLDAASRIAGGDRP